MVTTVKTETQTEQPKQPLYCSLSELLLNQLFVYKGDLFYLMETPATIMNEQGLDTFDITNGMLKARKIAQFVRRDGSAVWYGLSNPYVENFHADSVVMPFTYDPTLQPIM